MLPKSVLEIPRTYAATWSDRPEAVTGCYTFYASGEVSIRRALPRESSNTPVPASEHRFESMSWPASHASNASRQGNRHRHARPVYVQATVMHPWLSKATGSIPAAGYERSPTSLVSAFNKTGARFGG